VVHNREQTVALMDAGEIDLSVMGRVPRELGVQAEAFAENPLAFICNPRHPLLSRASLGVKSLSEYGLIVREQGAQTRMAMEAFLVRHQCPLQIAMEISSNEAIKQTVMAGIGLGFVPLQIISLELRNRVLGVIKIDDTPVMSVWTIVHLQSKTLSPIAEAFRHFILDQGKKAMREHNSLLLSMAFRKRKARPRISH
jgi:DNA-binding transcriptional LysR family regulator